MAFTLGNEQLSRAYVQLPQYGVWNAQVKLAKKKELQVGSAVALQVGDLTLQGTVRSGGTFFEVSEYLIVGGADGWSKPVKRRAYRADNGVRMSTVANDLAVDAGEKIMLEPGTERTLGYAWSRPEGIASLALGDLQRAWWVDAAGVTHLGPRPASVVPSRVKVAVSSFDPTFPRLFLGIPDDTVSPFQPGVTLSGQGLPSPFKVSSVEIRVNDRRVSLELWGQ
jgi:hypothetical protein